MPTVPQSQIERTRASYRLSSLVDGWLKPFVGVWTWEQAATYVLRVEILCLQASEQGEPTTPPRRLPRHSRELWEIVRRWKEDEAASWLEAARALHADAAWGLKLAHKAEIDEKEAEA